MISMTNSIPHKSTGIQAPWYTVYNKVVALFGNDEELQISNLSEVDDVPDNGFKCGYGFTISSKNSVKLKSIEKILKRHFEFGNVYLNIDFVYEPQNDDVITPSDFKNAFAGNNILSKVQIVPTPAGVPQTFVVFAREVIQFYNDDITDLYGNFNGLSEDIARELFNDTDASICYCTDIIPANE